MDNPNAYTTKNTRYSLQRTLLNLFFLLTVVIIIAINISSYYQVEKFVAANRLNESVFYTLHQINLFILSASTITLLIIFIGLLVFNRQLSRQLTAENKLRKSEALLKGIMDGSNDFIAALDLNFRYIAFNQSYQKEFKRVFDKQVSLGMRIQDALTHLPDEQKKVIEIWQRALNGEEFTVIGQFGAKKVDQLSYEVTFSSIRDQSGNLIGASHIARNIEKRVEAEKAAITANERLKFAYQELKEHDEGVSLLNEMDTVLQTCLTINEALELVGRYCRKLFPFAAGIIYLTHRSGNYLVARKNWNTPQNNLQTFFPAQCLALRREKLYYFFNKPENICCQHYIPKDEVQWYFCVPLLAQNEHIGLLYFEIKKTDHQTEEQINQTVRSYKPLINNLAGLIALSITNIRLKDDLKTRSIRDPLTNLYNRTYLNESLEREINRAERSHIMLAIIMVDLDHFKNINDTFGHQAGDLMLQTIGEVLLREVRKSDIACRYGGEEFLLALYDTSLKDAISRAEHIRKKISHTKFHFATETTAITASLGIAIYPEHGQSMDELIKAADKALYQSKKNGRNKLMVYQKQS